MHLILLSGGSGKRLWPLSNDVRSKQFLKVLPGKEGADCNRESMVQRVHRQIVEVGEKFHWDSITVAGSALQKDILGVQLGKDINIVIEPERRDTFPAIALACSYLYSEKKVSQDEVIAVLPVDPFVENEYFECIAKMEELIKLGNTNLVLMGATPFFPSEKYGYIVPDMAAKGEALKDGSISLPVKMFKEKPKAGEARVLINNGALWNCGVFGLRLGYILSILQDKYGVTDLSFSSMLETFRGLKKTSFDYEVVEKAKGIKLIKYDGPWKDLGTWETLTEEMADKTGGNVIIDDSCENTHVINDYELPVAVMGVKNAVIVASSDGILVANKGDTPKVKELLKEHHMRPMYEEKRWGTYTVLNHTELNDGHESLTKKLLIRAGCQISYQYHEHRKEIWSIISGEGELYINGERSHVAVGDVIRIKEGDKHAIRAITDLQVIEVQIGHPLVEEDILRLDYDWK